MTDVERDNYVHPGKRFAKNGIPVGVGQGMSLRDYFAGQALANPDICRRDDKYPQRTAYSFADAMLKAREESQ